MALITCKECGKEISSQAATCPGCGAKVTKDVSLSNIFVLFGVAGIILVVGILIAMFGSGGSSSRNNSTPTEPPSAGAIYYTSTEIVKKFLKSPTTAKFPDPQGQEAGATVTRFSGNNIWHVWGYVDSQNGFGAMIRSDWTMEAEVTGQHVLAKEVSIDGKKVYE